MAAEIIRFLLTISGGILVALFSYEYIEVRRKRKIETYWRIESEYKSETQQRARKLIEKVEEEIKRQEENLKADYNKQEVHNKLVDYYNAEFHNSSDQEKRMKHG